MSADRQYQLLITRVCRDGRRTIARNAETRRVFDADPITFYKTPLVTLRKTAWRLALREMEWFLSGDPKCPVELLPWWSGQLSPDGFYFDGYGEQLRNWKGRFDQVAYLIDGLKNHPTSRRHLLTTWDASDMAEITETNHNPATPACCHTTLAQFFVEEGVLYMTSVQRSADLLLGVQHNWLQSWALFLWLAHQTGLKPGWMRWIFGDLHIYTEDSHTRAVQELLAATIPPDVDAPALIYTPTIKKDFRASDFEMTGVIPDPQSLTRPKLL